MYVLMSRQQCFYIKGLYMNDRAQFHEGISLYRLCWLRVFLGTKRAVSSNTIKVGNQVKRLRNASDRDLLIEENMH